jgi:hypothetical protein
VILITSATYVENQLRAEIGDIPPAFLPLGNRRLFQHQLDLINRSQSVAISLPEGFAVPPQDAAMLESAGVRLLHPPSSLSLAKSIAWCLACLKHDGPVEILHGDTLFDELPTEGTPPDAVSVVCTADHYDWATVQPLINGRLRVQQQFGGGDPSQPVLSGWFRFSSAKLLAEAMLSSSSFIAGLERYSMERHMQCVTPSEWRDVGHTSTYLRIRAEHTRERAFNSLKSDTIAITKTGPRNKILNEAAWYQNLPGPLRVYAPTFLSLHDDGETATYHLEYLYLLSLSDLYVFGALPEPVWGVIFGACNDALQNFHAHKPPSPETLEPNKLLLAKTMSRLEDYAASSGVDLDAEYRINDQPTPSLRRVAELSAAAIQGLPDSQLSWIHGDPCFSNVFFDFRSERVKMIDPRGSDAKGKACPWGDPRYDVAKLAHSAYGGYDLIVSDRYTLLDTTDRNISIHLDYTDAMLGARSEFLRTQFSNWRGDDVAIQAIVVQLFLSMIPLHADTPQRQRAYLANAMALFHWMDRGVDLR